MSLHKEAPCVSAAGLQSQTKGSLQSQTIDWLRFPLALAVVFIHSFGLPSEVDVKAIDYGALTGMDVYNLFRIMGSHVLTHIAVPTFFLISGFLFFLKMEKWSKELYVSKMKKRWTSLVIPYLCWNAIAVLVVVTMKIGAFLVKGKPLSNILLYIQEQRGWHLLWDCNVWGENRLNWLGWPVPMSGPVDLPLWFLRDLIVVSFCTPLIYYVLKYFRHWGMLLLAFAYVSGIWPSCPGFTVTTFFFFSWGAYLSMNRWNLVTSFRRYSVLSYGLSVILLLATTALDGKATPEGMLVYPFYVIAGVVAVVNLASSLLERGIVRCYPFLAQASFFIFASHTIMILGKANQLTERLLPIEHPLLLTVRYLVTPCVAVAGCLLLYVLLRHYAPRLLSVLMGNR